MSAWILLGLDPPPSPLSDVLEPVEDFLHWLLDLPVQATAMARRIDELQYVQFAFMWLLGVIVFGAAIWFTVRYARRRMPAGPTPEVRAPLWLEILVAGGLLASFVVFWVVGFGQYVDASEAPPGAVEVYVTAKQWVWKFSYADGPSAAGALFVPAGRPVRLVLTSRDVIHSFYVPAFRLKRDAIPGRYTTTWFQADRVGRYDVLCAEFCGAGHSRMWAEVVVLPPDQFDRWLAQQGPPEPVSPLRGTPLTAPAGVEGRTLTSLARRGVLVAQQQGCLRCHTLDGEPHIGPTWKGLFGSRVALAGGGTVVADTPYLTRSMMDPMAEIVAGYAPLMPTFQGRMQPGEVAAVVELIKSLGGPAGKPRRAGGAGAAGGGGGDEVTSDAIPIGRFEKRAGASYLTAERGVLSWLTTKDHKRIGVMYLVLTSLAMALGGTFALLMRLELLTPGQTFVTTDVYDRFFTLHGVIMVWLFMIPAIPNAFGNFLLPILIGAEDVAFPRLNLASVYVYLAGATVVLYAVVAGGVDTGWTFYTPYSTGSPTNVSTVALGVFILGISTIMTGINFIVTTHTLRAEGLSWMKLPLFVWTIYATAIIQVLATPVLGMTLALVALDHAFHVGVFDPAVGGDPVLYQHLFWFYSHPAVYIMILPAMGVISEVVSTFARKNPFSYRGIVVSTLGIAFVGFLTWGHHMFVAGLSLLDAGIFGALSMFVAIFSAIKVFSWVGTLYKGSISFKTPMLYFFEFVFLFGVGGTTGVALASTSLDIHWHDTYFVVAHFHFIMVGATMTGFLAALHYWFPKMFGRRYPERLGMVAAVLVFMGFIGTFVPQFLLGNGGMPRRYADYPAHFQPLHVISTVGSWSFAAGLGLVLAYLLWSLRNGPVATANPWGSRSFEWEVGSPPPPENWPAPPVFHRGSYDYFRKEG